MHNLYVCHFSCGDTQDIEAQADQLSFDFPLQIIAFAISNSKLFSFVSMVQNQPKSIAVEPFIMVNILVSALSIT